MAAAVVIFVAMFGRAFAGGISGSDKKQIVVMVKRIVRGPIWSQRAGLSAPSMPGKVRKRDLHKEHEEKVPPQHLWILPNHRIITVKCIVLQHPDMRVQSQNNTRNTFPKTPKSDKNKSSIEPE